MTSISTLKEQVATLTEASKSSNVAKAVQKVQRQLKEQSLVSDVLKGLLAAATSKTREEVRTCSDTLSTNTLHSSCHMLS